MINIDDLIGKPYINDGRNNQNGYDCFGLAIEVSRRFGHELYDVGIGYSDKSEFNRRELICLQNTKVKKIESPKTEGDLLLLKDNHGVISHIGVYLGNDMFIHCNKEGVHVSKVSKFKHIIGRVYTWL